MHKLIYQPGRVWGRAGLALLLLGCALLNSACSDAFIPPPEDLPPGQTAPEPEAVPLGPPPDLWRRLSGLAERCPLQEEWRRESPFPPLIERSPLNLVGYE